MKMMGRSVLLTAIIVGLSLGISRSAAQDSVPPEALQAARDLVSVFGDSMISEFSARMTAQTWPAIEKSLRTADPNVDATTIAELREKFEQAQIKNISDSTNNLAAIYARNFTAQELRDMLAFYRTPTGAKTLRVMPKVTAEVYASLLPALQASSQELKRTFHKILDKPTVSLAGSWCNREKPNSPEFSASITQKGTTLSFRSRGRGSRGHFESSTVVIADDWGALRGQLSADNNRIDWANGGVWLRKRICGRA